MMLAVWLAAGGIMVHSTAVEIYEGITLTAEKHASSTGDQAANTGPIFYTEETANSVRTALGEELPDEAKQDAYASSILDGNARIDDRYWIIRALDFYPDGSNVDPIRAYTSHITLEVGSTADTRINRRVVLDTLSCDELVEIASIKKVCTVSAVGRDAGYYFYPDTLTIGDRTYTPGLGDGATDTWRGTSFKQFTAISPYNFDEEFYTLWKAGADTYTSPEFKRVYPPSLSELMFTEAITTRYNKTYYGVRISATVHLTATPLKTAFFEHLPDLGQLALLCALLGLVFFRIVRRLIVRPIRETAEAAQAMSAEKLYGFPYDSERRDEIGALGSALHDMSYRLRGQWEAERELERQRQEFLAAASHDLKTPLALIGGSAEAIAQEIDPDENARYLATIERECARMNGMIAQMLDASRMSRMQYLEKKAPFDLPILLEDLLLDRTVLFGARPIAKHLPCSLSYCGDRNALGRAIGAMLDNAAQYSAPDAKITVTLTDLRPGFRLTIENEGAPIPAGDLPHLFELFYRADHARDRKGNGIGLAVAARVFDLHGLKYRAVNTKTDVKFVVETL